MRHARERDGILYITTGPCSVDGRGQMLYAYNLKTGEVKEIGRPVPKIECTNGQDMTFHNAYGMDFDSKGRLWYGCMTFTKQLKYCGARLYMWDFLSGKEPVDLGFIGSKKRTLSIPAELNIVDDVIFISDGNHMSDKELYCGIIAIDLKEFEPAIETEERIPSHDYVNYMPYPEECAKYYPLDDYEKNWNKFYNKYQFELKMLKFKEDNFYSTRFPEVRAISYWEDIHRENTKVNKLEWADNDNLTIYCGTKKTYKIDVNLTDMSKKITEHPEVLAKELKAEVPENAKLPFMPGRQYLAVPNASLKMGDGSIIVGTKDMMLAKINGDKIYNIGAATTCGKVHSLVNANGTIYGIAGYEKGACNLFRYSEESGMEQLGNIPTAFADNGRQVCIFNTTTMEISPDKTKIAIGGADELGGVIIIKI